MVPTMLQVKVAEVPGITGTPFPTPSSTPGAGKGFIAYYIWAIP